MNSQNTKAIGGSNCSFPGASRFHPNQNTVQTKTIRKKPMVPTRLVIEQASPSSALNFSEASLLTFRIGFRCSLNSSSESGFRDFTADVSLMAKIPPHNCWTYSMRLSDRLPLGRCDLPTKRKVNRNHVSSILFSSSFDMETMQHAVKDRCQ